MYSLVLEEIKMILEAKEKYILFCYWFIINIKVKGFF